MDAGSQSLQALGPYMVILGVWSALVARGGWSWWEGCCVGKFGAERKSCFVWKRV